MTCSYDADPVNNSWDFVLMIEGTLLFAASSVKKLNAQGPQTLSYPFCVRTSSAAYGSAAANDAEKSRNEMWVPLWKRPCALGELQMLFSEGRAQVGRANAVRGVDFARAIATLGTDRGIAAFRRFGFQERNGLSYLAVDLGLWRTKELRTIHLIKECERWMERLRGCAQGSTAPARLIQALRRYDEAVMNACKTEGRLTAVLMALGGLEQAIIQRPRTATDNGLSPLPLLSPDWIEAADDGSPEFRLACSLASIRGLGDVGALRSNMIPCDPAKPWLAYGEGRMNKPHVVWSHGTLADNLLAVLKRRCMDAERCGLRILPLRGVVPAPLADVLAFIRGELDERRITALLWGLNAVDWRQELCSPPTKKKDEPSAPPPGYALMKLTHAVVRPDGSEIGPGAPGIPYDPAILALAAAGRVDALRVATRRLRASGWKPLIDATAGAPEHLRRYAAAALFPLSRYDFRRTASAVMRFSSMHDAQKKTEARSATD